MRLSSFKRICCSFLLIWGFPILSAPAGEPRIFSPEWHKNMKRMEREILPVRMRGEKNQRERIDAFFASNPDDFKRFIRLSRFRHYPPSPLLIADGFLYCAQPDGTLTVLNLQTGDVVKRIRPPNNWGRRADLNAKHFEALDTLVIGYGEAYRPEAFVLDVQTGKFLFTGLGSIPFKIGNYLIVDERGSSKSGITSYDAVARKRVQIPSAVGSSRDLFGADGKLYVFCETFEFDFQFLREDSDHRREGVLECIDPATGKKIWSIGDNGAFWLGVTHDDENIYIFEGEKGVDYGSDACTNIRVVTLAGIELEALTPGEELFGGKTPVDYSLRSLADKDFPFLKRTGKTGKRRGRDNPPDEAAESRLAEATEKFGLPAYDNAYVHSPDGAIFGMAAQDELKDRKVHFYIYYLDDTASWRARVNCLGDFEAYCRLEPRLMQEAFSFAIGGEEVVYATRTGKIECLDRKTGESRWLYIYPLFDQIPGGQDFFGLFKQLDVLSPAKWDNRWGESFFRDDIRMFEEDARYPRAGGAGVGENGSIPHTRVVVDPDPAFSYVEGVRSAQLLLWGIPGMTLLILLAKLSRGIRPLRRNGGESAPRRGSDTYFSILITANILVFLNLLVFFRYGRYDFPPVLFLAVVTCAVPVFAVWGCCLVAKTPKTGNRARINSRR